MYVVGTAGHVDHGKSALVQALTGIDPDRLREEKSRGMTIDLGFAWLQLPGGREVSLVDVPGHERFIKNMLAGVGGIDLALLVVAADEGVMPQTREHLAILDLLQIKSAVIAISKCDLVDEEWLELVKADVEEVLAETALAGSPLIACSALTRAGLPELLACIESRLDQTPPKRDIGRPRLSVDRAFSMSGFGTVVTGTLIDGSLRTGQEVELLPAGRRVRIRGLQMHRHKMDRAEPGSRTAINLAGIATDEVARGALLTTPGWLEPTTAVDVRLRSVPDLGHPIRHNVPVTFHAGAKEVAAKVRLLDRSDLPPGQSCWAQIRLAEATPLVKGDSFIIRTPNETAGGGTVVDSHPKRHRRHHQPTLAALDTMERGTPEDAVFSILAKLGPADAALLARETDLGIERTRQALASLLDEGRVVRAGGGDGTILTAESFHALLNQALALLDTFFREHPLRLGMPREELKSRLGLRTKLFNDLLARWLSGGDLEESGALLTTAGRQVQLSRQQEEAAQAFLTDLAAAAFAPATDHLPEPELLAYLVERGDVTVLSEGMVFGAEAYRTIVSRITAHLHEHGTVTLAQVRDLLGTSRKYAQAILEHLDEERITRRVGDERVLRSPEAARR